MAYSIRFSGVSKADGTESFHFEPDWWSVDEVRKCTQFKWVETNDTGSYTDEDADISADEASQLFNKFKRHILKEIEYNAHCVESYKKDTDQYAAIRVNDHEKHLASLKAELETIQSALGVDRGKFSHFHVRIFEWESGY